MTGPPSEQKEDNGGNMMIVRFDTDFDYGSVRFPLSLTARRPSRLRKTFALR